MEKRCTVVPPFGAHHRCARHGRHEHVDHDPVQVVEGHDVDTDVVWFQAKRGADAQRRRAEVAMGDWHQLRLERCPRRVQQQARVISAKPRTHSLSMKLSTAFYLRVFASITTVDAIAAGNENTAAVSVAAL
jgi:hypothetical protein